MMTKVGALPLGESRMLAILERQARPEPQMWTVQREHEHAHAQWHGGGAERAAQGTYLR
jgi:hypothetical protein